MTLLTMNRPLSCNGIKKIRAEIALPSPSFLRADAGRLPEYQQQFRRLMRTRGALLRSRFGNAVEEIHPGIGTISVIGLPQTIRQIVEESRGNILALHNHWEKDAVRHSKTLNHALPLEMAVH